MTDPLDDLAEARSKIEATRAALQAALDALNGQDDHNVDVAPIRALADRLDRMAAEVARIEGVVADQSKAAPAITRA